MDDKDWEARFRLSETRKIPTWLLVLMICGIPFGPWYVDLPVTLLLGVFLYLRCKG
jgi:hypothetical protein